MFNWGLVMQHHKGSQDIEQRDCHHATGQSRMRYGGCGSFCKEGLYTNVYWVVIYAGVRTCPQGHTYSKDTSN